MPRYPAQLSLAQKFQQQQQQQQHQLLASHHLQQLNHPSQIHHPTGVSSPASLSASLTPQLAAGTTSHYQQQLNYATLSRQSSSSHYRARSAAAVARSANNSAAVPITDPNGSSKTGTPILANGGANEGGISGADKAAGNDAGTQPWKILDLGGMGLKNLSRELFGYSFLTALYINHNNLHHLSSDISRLKHLTILDASGNKLTTVPPEIGLLTHLQELLLVDNALVTLPPELGTLFQLEIVALEGNPLNESLRNMLQQEGTGAVIAYLRENCPVPLPPPEREWIMLEDSGVPNPAGSDTFTVFCYNILAEKYATPQMYGYTPSWALSWEYRKELILQEILAYSADIVCLQEVESGQYEDYFKDQMKQQADYDSVFFPKSRAKTMAEKDRKSVDGCATFFKASKFSLMDKRFVEFNQVAMQRPEKTEDLFNRVMNKDNICIITLLEHKDTNNRIVVANTHIHWDPTFKDVKLVQAAMLMDEVERFSDQWTDNSASDASASQHVSLAMSGKLPTLICGDFNSEPNSGVCEFLTKGTVAQGHDDFGDHAYGTYTSEGLSHNVTLRSSYTNELPFTNFTPSYQAIIDHIYYSASHLSVLGLLGGIEKDYMGRCVGFPNAHFPSDHIPILSEFKFRVQPTLPRTAPNFGTTGSNGGHPRNMSGDRR
ncbi:MAG: Endonuclease/exonuclease/phosphatase [Benniella sp.]|nr:MAG: Endonuclease/exonuclease/phosphatase [Benniella sp.]